MNALENAFLELELSTPTLPIQALQITVYAIKGCFFGLNDIVSAHDTSNGNNRLNLGIKNGLRVSGIGTYLCDWQAYILSGVKAR